MKLDPKTVDENLVIHCDEEWKAKIYCDYMHSLGYKWAGNESFEETTFFDRNDTKTCYRPATRTYAGLGYYRAGGFTVVEFDYFEWDAIKDLVLDESVFDQMFV